MKNGFRVMDSDMHIIEPADLWLRYIDPAFKDRAPRGLTDTVADGHGGSGRQTLGAQSQERAAV